MSPIALPTPPETPSLTPHLKPTTLPPHTTHTTHTTQTTHTPTAQLHHATPQPLAVSAEGMYVHLADGRTLLDSVSGGAAVASLGMGNAEVVQTMTDQAAKMAYAYHQLLGSGPGEELAEWLVSRGKGRFEAAAFLNSGE
jgi:adenosylmethionine-8-amino-7-oxononanoate aminotransferase